ncbi:hypothetical protein BCR35DRAFT_324390, partial [Leucosporidium creatinivorum]
MSKETVRVAVVGTGLAGLVTGYLLQTLQLHTKDGLPLHFHVELFEKSAGLGMDSSSISVEAEGGSFRLDTPMRSINGGSHSSVQGLYKHLDIALRRSDFSYSFSRLARPPPRPTSTPPPPYSETTPSPSPPNTPEPPLRPEQTSRYLYEGSNGLKFPPLAFPSPLASASIFTRLAYLFHLALLSLSYLHLLFLAFFYSSAGLIKSSTSRRAEQSTARRIADLLGLSSVADESLEKWCRRHWVWKGMQEEVLVPLYAAVCTVGRTEARGMPIAECLDYIVSTFASSHYVAEVGVQQVVRRLAAPIPLSSIHLSSTITSIARTTSPTGASQLILTLIDGTSPAPFDHLIFATQANQASSLLSFLPPSSARDTLINALNTFSYIPTLVVNHTDESILPPNPQDRRDLNLSSFSPPSSPLEAKLDNEDRGTENTMPMSSIQATHIISRTHPRLAPKPSRGEGKKQPPLLLLQTTNPLLPISPSHILSSTWYERAYPTITSHSVLPGFLLGAEGGGGGGMQNLEKGIWFCGS